MNKPSNNKTHVCGRDCDYDPERGCDEDFPLTDEGDGLADVDPDYGVDEDDADLIEELIADGYSPDEARRMVGESDDEIFYGFDDLDRDVPEWDEEEDE